MASADLHDAASTDEVIAAMVGRIVDQFDPERILLFGSRARGEGSDLSDVDLLVVMPNGTDRREAAVNVGVAVGDLPVAKDIIVTTPAHIAQRGNVIGTVLRPAMREGKTLYERG